MSDPAEVSEGTSGKDEPSDSSSSTTGSVKGDRKQQFSGSCSFVVSLLGFSMGTSDFWRFPYLVYRNGGGAFLIPFVMTMLICGVSLMFLEVSMSQFSGKGPINIWQMSPFFKGIGFSLLLINIINNIYYNILRAWILEYFVSTFNSELPWKTCNHTWNVQPGIECVAYGDKDDVTIQNGSELQVLANLTNGSSTTTMTAAEQFWQYEVLKLSPGLDDLGGIMWNFVLYVFIWRLFVTLSMIKSIKSIEKVMFATVFIPVVLMFVLWVRTLLLEGSVSGMLYYLTPTFSRITDIQVWLEAAMMASYTLGPAWGSVILIGGHNKFESNCLRHSIVTTIFDCLSAILNGLICFSILGVMAHDSGLDIDKVVTSGLSLGFTVYPTAFTFFPLPQLWCALFFANLILVGLDAQVLSTETVMCCFEELAPSLFRGKRRVCMLIMFNVVFFLVSIPFCTQGGCYIFQLLDWYALAWTLLVVSLVECIVFMWIYGGDRVNQDILIMLGRPMPHILRVSGAFFTPVILVILIVLSFMRYKPPTYGSYAYPVYAQAIGWAVAIVIVLPIFVVFLLKMVTTTGSLKKRFSRITRPSEKWSPNDEVKAERYYIYSPSSRSLFTLLLYNLTGNDRTPGRTAYALNGTACSPTEKAPMLDTPPTDMGLILTANAATDNTILLNRNAGQYSCAAAAEHPL